LSTKINFKNNKGASAYDDQPNEIQALQITSLCIAWFCSSFYMASNEKVTDNSTKKKLS
jgi:hypothetical protein